MLQNDVYNAGGANTVSSADPNDIGVDEFVTTIVKKLAREVADSAGQRALKDPEHGEKEILGKGCTGRDKSNLNDSQTENEKPPKLTCIFDLNMIINTPIGPDISPLRCPNILRDYFFRSTTEELQLS